MFGKLKVGIIGLGVGAKHFNAFNKNNKSKVISICDFNLRLLKNFKKQYPNLKITQNSDDIIYNQEVDIVAIASYDDFHFEHICKALKNKKHVFIEKPLCLTTSEFKKIVHTQKKFASQIISSNMVLRANPRFDLLRKAFKNNEYKNLYYIQSDYFWGRRHKLFDWRSKLKNYSLILGASIHLIDLILWIINKKPIAVQSFGNRLGASSKMIKSNTFSSINLYFKNGLIININAHGLISHPHFHSIKFFSDTSTFMHQFRSPYISSENNGQLIIDKIKEPYPFKSNRHLIIDEFINKILNKKTKDCFVDFQSIKDCMIISMAALESEKKQKKIKINYF